MKKILLLVVMTKVVFALGQTDTLTITRTMDDVDVVAGNIASSSYAVSTTSDADLHRSNMGENLPVLLSSTPGLIVTSDDGIGIGYTYFRLRGSDHTRINVTLDDVPINNSESQTMFWVNLSDIASSASSIEVQRGVGSSVNGSEAFGGSIGLQSAKALSKPHFADVTLNAGMFGTFRANLSGGWQWNNGCYVRGRLSKTNSKGYVERATSDLASYDATVGWQNADTHLSLHAFGGFEKTYMAWDGLSREQITANRRQNNAGLYIKDNGDTAYYSNQTDNYQEHHVQLTCTRRLNSAWSLRTTGFYTFGKGYFEQLQTTTIRQKHLLNHFYGALLNVRYVSEPADLQMGTAISNYAGQHFGINYAHFVDTLSDEIGKKENSAEEFYRGRGDKLDANIYARTNVRLLRRAREELTLFADLQYRMVWYRISGMNDVDCSDINISRFYHFFNPKIGLTYTNHGHTAYANFAIANREPTRQNFTMAGMNNQPHPEQLYDLETGYTFGISRPRAKAFSHVQTGINLYYMHYKDQLVLTGKMSDIGECLTQNVAKSYRMGAEITANMQILPWFNWQTNLCLSRNKILDFIDFFDTYNADFQLLGQTEMKLGDVDIAFSPAVTFSSAISVATHGFEGTLQTQVVSKQYLNNTMSESAMLRAYSVSHLTMQYLLPFPDRIPQIRLMLKINNLFNAKYENNGGCYAYLVTTSEHFHSSDAPFSRGDIISSPWFYPQATINVHAGINIRL